MVKPGHRVQFRLDALSSYGNGKAPVRIPVKCWRFTATFTPNVGAGYTVDGVDFTKDFQADRGASGQFVNTVTIRVGGVFTTDGNPVLLDQDMIVTPFGALPYGLLCFEDIVRL